jgi:ankyrin repeat protein
MLSTPEIVQLLIQHGSRLVARLADGRTALHLAAARGNLDMVRMILQKSEENEEEEAKKEEARKQARIAARETSKPIQAEQTPEPSADSDIEFVEEEDLDDDVQSTTTGSFVKVKEEEKKASEDAIPEDEDGPDVYDVNVLSWDTRCSPLHYAILNGHTEVVRELVQTFGADPLLPIKLLSSFDRSPQGAILTLVLALQLPLERAKAMTQTLLEIGASSAQADMRQTTALHYVSLKNPEVLDTLFEHDEPAARRAIDHLAVGSGLYSPNAQSPLMSAISAGNAMAAMKLLEAGSAATVEFKDWIKSVGYRHPEVIGRDAKRNQEQFEQDVEQPVVLAVQSELPEIVIALLERGADPNSIPKNTATELQTQHNGYGNYHPLETLLDMVRNKIQSLNDYRDDAPPVEPEYRLQEGVDYFRGIEPGSYMDFIAKMRVEAARLSDKTEKEAYEKKMRDYIERKGVAEKQEAIKELAEKFVNVEKELLARGAKTFAELRPDVIDTSRRANGPLPRHSLAVGSQPFKVEFDFAVHDLTEETREAYLKL